MNDQIQNALTKGHVIDMTTTGRKTGEPRRIEIVFHNMDGRLIITGMPRANSKRAWLANLEANPQFTFHLKGAIDADLPAEARVITDPTERRAVAEWVVANAWDTTDPTAMTADSPMIEVTIEDRAA